METNSKATKSNPATVRARKPVDTGHYTAQPRGEEVYTSPRQRAEAQGLDGDSFTSYALLAAWDM